MTKLHKTRVWLARHMHVYHKAEHLFVGGAGVGMLTGLHTIEVFATSSLVVVMFVYFIAEGAE